MIGGCLRIVSDWHHHVDYARTPAGDFEWVDSCGAWSLMTWVEWLVAYILNDRFGALDLQIHHHGILAAPDYHGFTRNIWTGINFLMRDVGRNVNEVSWVGLIAEL